MAIQALAGLWRALALIALLAALPFAVPSAAQDSEVPAGGSRAQIEAIRLDLQQIEAALSRERLEEARLNDLRQRLVPLAQKIEEIIQREQPRVDEIKARIDQLGPAPDVSKGQSESVEVARDRAEQDRLWKEADETLRLARALGLRADQSGQAISDRRRQNFTREILAQHPAIINPWLWVEITKTLPADIRAFNFLLQQWGETIAANLSLHEAVILLLVLVLFVVVQPRARRWVETGTLFHAAETAGAEEREKTRLQKLMRALRRLALATLVPGAALLLLNLLLDRFELLPGRANSVMDALLTGLIFLVFMRGLSRAILAPGRPGWRIVELSDDRAAIFSGTIFAFTLVVVIGRVADAWLAAIVASLPLTIATRGVFAILAVLVIARGLSRAFGRREAASVEDIAEAGKLWHIRLLGWLSVVVVIGAGISGYVPFASFLVTQLTWIMALAFSAVLALAFIEELVGAGVSSGGFLGRRVRDATGMTASALDQASVLGSGFLKLVLFVALALLVLAPWGVDSQSFLSNVRAAFFGFQVGGITISLSTIALAIGLFAVGYFITRAIQNWLDSNYLPRTTLDPGLQNSIRTMLGYVGIVLAAMFALSQLGLSLDKLTIVAGALSVGIGFGLKSIVENFISGLILLWERPIRVGDWIVVGDEQGTVKRINVRSTEILTFDRASLIIPNSEFISGRVKNWVHADRTARIIVPVGVDYSADPQVVQKILLDSALAHIEIMSEPKPIVIFKNLGENGLDFELRCFTDVDSMSTTRSDLLFDIYRRLQEAGVMVSSPTRRLEITNLPPMVDPRGLPRQEDERDG
ncbi:MAG: mechanosensitive ion channel family protein [Rhizobiales bacterium]|nr:mechanosensitive ion channel family protein [Hyphomicrobiales bacterium]